MNAPDRSGPSYNLVDDAVLNEGPVFPFEICPAKGFFALTPTVEYNPADILAEVVVTGLCRRTVNSIIAVEVARGVAITPARIYIFGDGWSAAATDWEDLLSTDSEQLALNEQSKYIFTIGAPDKDTVTVKIQDYSSGKVLKTTTSYNSTDLWNANPSFVCGHPADAQIVGLNLSGAVATPGLTIFAQQEGNPGPSDITVLPAVATTAAEVGYWVGNLWATHPRAEACPCTFALVAGTGDTNNALFSIRGTNLHVAGALTAGAKSIRVQAMDKYGATFAKALTVTVS